MDAPVGTFIAYATAPGKTATDSGEYRECLIQNMRVPGLQIEQVFKNTRKAMVERTNGVQVPWDASSLVDTYYLVPGPAPAPDPDDHHGPAPRPSPGRDGPPPNLDADARADWTFLDWIVQQAAQNYPDATHPHLKAGAFTQCDPGGKFSAATFKHGGFDWVNIFQFNQFQMCRFFSKRRTLGPTDEMVADWTQYLRKLLPDWTVVVDDCRQTKARSGQTADGEHVTILENPRNHVRVAIFYLNKELGFGAYGLLGKYEVMLEIRNGNWHFDNWPDAQ
jgi:hypothetical protein